MFLLYGVHPKPMRDFVNRALRAQKIAREKNNCHNLAVVAKKVGSNYSLFNRRLSADLNFPFAALASGGGVASAAPNKFAISQLVPVEGLEPPCLTVYGSKPYASANFATPALVIGLPISALWRRVSLLMSSQHYKVKITAEQTNENYYFIK